MSQKVVRWQHRAKALSDCLQKPVAQGWIESTKPIEIQKPNYPKYPVCILAHLAQQRLPSWNSGRGVTVGGPLPYARASALKQGYSVLDPSIRSSLAAVPGQPLEAVRQRDPIPTV